MCGRSGFPLRPTASAAGRDVPPITLPPVALAEISDDVIEEEARAAQARVIERRVVRAGRDAWEAIHKVQTFDGWAAISRALAVGREYALRVTGAKAPIGRAYSLAFSAWAKDNGFAGMQKSVRSVAIELAEHANAITHWRDSLPERQRRRLIHPLSCVRRWRAATGQYQAQRFRDAKREAEYAWRRFVACVRSLPAEQAGALWEMVYTEAARHA
jgi:hypothetical protein